jgi:ribosome-binding factor A
MTQRTERLGEGFREILAEHIQRLKDPRVGFVTVIGVRVSPDLRHAWVTYSSYGDEKARAGTRAALRSAAPHLRSALGREVRLKYVPDLTFEEDLSVERDQKLDELLRQALRDDADEQADRDD